MRENSITLDVKANKTAESENYNESKKVMTEKREKLSHVKVK